MVFKINIFNNIFYFKNKNQNLKTKNQNLKSKNHVNNHYQGYSKNILVKLAQNHRPMQRTTTISYILIEEHLKRSNLNFVIV